MSFGKSQREDKQRAWVFWLICVAVVLPVVSLIVVAPLAAAKGYGDLAKGIYGAFTILCHQLPDRSYYIDNHQMAVCSRCTGVYAGFVLTLMLYPLLRPLNGSGPPRASWLLLAAAPLVIDFSVNLFGFWQNTHTSRLLTGAVLGGAVVFYVMPGAMEIANRRLPIGNWRSVFR